MKTCSKCKQTKPFSEFHKKKSSKDGLRDACKPCRKIERRERYINGREKEAEYAANYKKKFPEKRKRAADTCAAKIYAKFRNFLNETKNKPCMDCGGSFPPCAMDFDHRNPQSKSFVIAAGCNKPKDILLKEIEKCDLVCANCHREREYKRQHTGSSYVVKLVQSFKDGPCQDCNIQYSVYVMDFDHRNPNDKMFDISKPKKLKGDDSLRTSISKEVEKCDLVCANCHRIRTFKK